MTRSDLLPGIPLLAACLWLSACDSSAGATSTTAANSPVAAESPAVVAVSYPLAVSVAGSGSVVGRNIECPSASCASRELAGTALTLTAVPASNQTFLGWEGDCAGTQPACELLFDHDLIVRARYSSNGAGPVTQTPRETTIDNPLISESSGLARSQRSTSVLWTHNDSGGNAEGYALDLAGHYLGTLTLLGGNAAGTPETPQNLDWEDMASVTLDGKPYLVFADIGDNNAFRPNLTLYVVAEPDISALTPPFSLTQAPAWVIQFTYPDGARDCESLLLDGDERRFYMVSKRDATPVLYSGSLLPPASLPGVPSLGVLLLENLGPINIPRAAAGANNPDSFNFVTGGDINQSFNEALLTTYTHAYRYRRAAGKTWVQAFAQAPTTLEIPQYSQTEAITFAADHKSFFISSENAPYPLAEVPLP